ncbi:IS66 family insertion sequence element accessory protein TnpB [Pseudomonas brassicacearum]|uniref:IS66 family insertion sequence element accessory protein TnpB n=1 Tax=Pseudomonas brassicacearum TaxID=930166 RepID=UPI003857C177
MLVHDGFGIWLAARRLNQGKFRWPSIRHGSEIELDAAQLQALVFGPAMAARGFRRRDHTALRVAISPSVYRRELPALARSTP